MGYTRSDWRIIFPYAGITRIRCMKEINSFNGYNLSLLLCGAAARHPSYVL